MKGGFVIIDTRLEPDLEHIKDRWEEDVEIGTVIHFHVDVLEPGDVFPVLERQDVTDGIVLMRGMQGQQRVEILVLIREFQIIGQEVRGSQTRISRDEHIGILLLHDVRHIAQLGIVGHIAESVLNIEVLEAGKQGKVAHVRIIRFG